MAAIKHRRSKAARNSQTTRLGRTCAVAAARKATRDTVRRCAPGPRANAVPRDTSCGPRVFSTGSSIFGSSGNNRSGTDRAPNPPFTLRRYRRVCRRNHLLDKESIGMTYRVPISVAEKLRPNLQRPREGVVALCRDMAEVVETITATVRDEGSGTSVHSCVLRPVAPRALGARCSAGTK
jgi:hypothetical protein